MDEKKIENKKQRKQKSQNERNRNPRVYIFQVFSYPFEKYFGIKKYLFVIS